MRITFAIKESSHGLWCITNGTVLVHDKLRFAHAIRLSRALARVEHERAGGTVCVEMVCSEFSIALLKFSAVTAAGHLTNGRPDACRDQGKLPDGERNSDVFPVRIISSRPFVPGSANRLRAIS